MSSGVTQSELKTFYDLSKQLLTGYQDQAKDFAQRTKLQADSIGADLNRVLTPDVINILNKPEGESEEVEEVQLGDLDFTF